MRSLFSLLVVDDDEVHRVVSAFALENAGYHVRVAASGEEALRRAGEQLPDLILLDLNMPTMSGWETMHQLRGRPHTTHVPVVALTGTRLDDPAPLREAGFRGYASKALSYQRLTELVDGFLAIPSDPGWLPAAN